MSNHPRPLVESLAEAGLLTDPDEPIRCEADHEDGGVCLRRVRRDGSCPGEDDHA